MEIQYLPLEVYELMVKSMPIPCVDVACKAKDGKILYGWRIIEPLKNRWTLIGGRILKGESSEQAAIRQMKTYGIIYDKLIPNGVFSGWASTDRFDISQLFVATDAKEPTEKGFEFGRYLWSSQPPKASAPLARKMVQSLTRR